MVVAIAIAALIAGGAAVGVIASLGGTETTSPDPIIDDDVLVTAMSEEGATDSATGADAATTDAVDVFDVGLGDCFDDGALAQDVDTITQLPVVDCDGPHDNEVFAVFDMPDGSWPGEDAVDQASDEGCLERFEAFVGAAYEESRYVSTSLFPTQGSWKQGDREIVCFLYDIDLAKLVGTARGTEE